MHSLWAASWFADVEGFNRQAVVNQLFTMAIGISLGALLLGILADRLRKRGVATEVLLAAFGALFMLAELALILRVPLPPILPWSVVSMVGAATVLGYAIIADYFPVEIAARANGAFRVDRSSKPDPRRCQTWEASVRVSPLARTGNPSSGKAAVVAQASGNEGGCVSARSGRGRPFQQRTNRIEVSQNRVAGKLHRRDRALRRLVIPAAARVSDHDWNEAEFGGVAHRWLDAD